MKIKLVSGPEKNPLDVSIGSARTCYSKTLKSPDEVSDWEGKIPLAKDLLESGHHTTLQHSYFVFSMEGVSRLALWRFFHTHRFYNSDQVSQRYTTLNNEAFYLPEGLDSHDLKIFNSVREVSVAAYSKISNYLEAIYRDSDNKVERKIAKKKAIENARYILPHNVMANLYHTINLSTLIRYNALKNSIPDCTKEISIIVDNMVEEVILKYPETAALFNNESEAKFMNISDFSEPNEKVDVLNHSIYNLGIDGDMSFYADNTGAYSLFNLNESHQSFTVKYKISLTADAQNQRHRTSLGSRPILNDLDFKYNDFSNIYIPTVFDKSEEAKEIFIETIKHIQVSIDSLNNKDLKSYLLPNAFQFVLVESTNLIDFIHKTKMRFCLNAQEEIRFLTEDITDSLKPILDEKYFDFFVPPCVSRHRAGIRPICSEGARYCGIKEWKKDKYKIEK